MFRVAKRVLFVRDLLRPESDAEVTQLVALHGGKPEGDSPDAIARHARQNNAPRRVAPRSAHARRSARDRRRDRHRRFVRDQNEAIVTSRSITTKKMISRVPWRSARFGSSRRPRAPCEDAPRDLAVRRRIVRHARSASSSRKTARRANTPIQLRRVTSTPRASTSPRSPCSLRPASAPIVAVRLRSSSSSTLAVPSRVARSNILPRV